MSMTTEQLIKEIDEFIEINNLAQCVFVEYSLEFETVYCSKGS